MTDVESKAKSLLRKYGLTHHGELVIPALIPAIRIEAGAPFKQYRKLGMSRFGGEPDLPIDTPWPTRPSGRPLSFLAQINLAELPANHLEDTDLPQTGILQFWWDELAEWASSNCKRSPWGKDDPFGGQVIYIKDETSHLTRVPYPELPDNLVPKKDQGRFFSLPDFRPSRAHRMKFRPICSIERAVLHKFFFRCDSMSNEDAADDEWDRALQFYMALQAETRGPAQGNHRLLGSVYEVGSDLREYAQIGYSQLPGVKVTGERWPNGLLKVSERQKAHWVLLAKLDSDEKMKSRPKVPFEWMFGDAGDLTFWIRKQDLKKRKLENAVAVIDSP